MAGQVRSRACEAQLLGARVEGRHVVPGLYPEVRRRPPLRRVDCDLTVRVHKHNDGRGGRYTAARRPVTLRYSETQPTLLAAVRRERQIKRWTNAKKQALADGRLGDLNRLAAAPATMTAPQSVLRFLAELRLCATTPSPELLVDDEGVPTRRVAGARTMKHTKRARLEAHGWRVGSAQEFLDLSAEEAALIERSCD